MAEFLIRMKDCGDPADLENFDVAWKTGDILWVQPDGHEWGDHEDKDRWIATGHASADWPGQFGIVKIPGMSLTEALQYKVPLTDAGGKILRNARYKVDLSKLSQLQRDALASDAKVTTLGSAAITEKTAVVEVK